MRCIRPSPHTSPPASRRGGGEAAETERGAAPLYYHYLSAFASSFELWDSVQTINFPRGHGILKAYMGLRPQDPDTLEYEGLLNRHMASRRRRNTFTQHPPRARDPYLSVQSPLQQLRCLRPLSPDKTLSEIWHFAQRRARGYLPRSLVGTTTWSTRCTMINADDLENWTKGQWAYVQRRRLVSSTVTPVTIGWKNGVTYSNHGSRRR